MAQAGTLHDAFIDELRDTYDAEKQLTKALPKLAKAATSQELRTAFESHLEETRGHVERLEQVFESLDEKVRGKHCDGIAGIIEEGKSIIEEEFDEATMDACLIAAGQRAEHYEMAAYGTLVAWARGMGHERGGESPAGDARRREGGRRKADLDCRSRHQPGGCRRRPSREERWRRRGGRRRASDARRRRTRSSRGRGEASRSSIAADRAEADSIARAGTYALAYRPSIERRNRPSLTRSSSTTRHVLDRSPNSRAACSSVRLSPGISR